ncbi:MAG: hypothetical protein AAF317_17625 [Pseudomonadota bacterium]
MSRLWFDEAVLSGAGALSFDVSPGEHLSIIGDVEGVGEAIAAALTGRAKLSSGRFGVGETEAGGRLADVRGTIRPQIGVLRPVLLAPANPDRSLLSAIEEPLLASAPRLDAAERREKAVSLLVQLGGAPGWIGLAPDQLPPFALQTAMLARALIGQPGFLVAIDPLRALDPEEAAPLINTLQDLKGQGALGILMIHQDFGRAGHMADRIQILHGGECVEAGPARTIRLSPTHPYTRMLANSVPGFASA